MGILDKTFDTDFVVCAIDIGVAVSSVSFLYVKPGDDFEALHDKVYRVSKWPFHKDRTTDIPSALCYRNGKAIKNRMGANAKPPGPGEDWVVVKNFKTFVTTLGSEGTSNDSLPPGVTLARVYEDWLKFLFDAGSEAFVEQFDVPGDVWERRMCVFISPNEWGKAEQANVRKIIHRAGCIEYDEHVRFARESEATLHYCLYHGLADQLTAPVGLEFFVCNSGITTDIGFFKVISTDPLEFEEVSAAISLNLGSTDPDDFSAVNLIEAKIREKKRKTATHPKFLVMGGGYSRNIDARTQLSKKLKPDGIQVIAPLRGPADFGVNESPTVDGGLYSFLHNFVSARAAAATFGTNILITYDAATATPEQRRRFQNSPYHHGGTSYINHGWSTIVKKGDLVRDGETRKHSYSKLFREKPTENQTVSCTLYASYEDLDPTWIRDEKGEKLLPGFRELCTVSGPLHMDDVQLREIKYGGNQTAYSIPFHFDILFGSVTAQASLVWEGPNDKPAFAPCTFHPPHGSEAVWH